ncbi:MAG: hypothetical protein IPG64_11415 [Haliea sp.]|nr:hypothetical protein [Haliea sp.]
MANQLDHWTAVNILSGAPDDTAAIPSIPLWEDTSANLNDRARGYLDVNCAHCHSPGGAGDTSGLFLDYFRPFGPSVGACKPPVAAGGGSGGLLYDIVPGNSTESILVYRMAPTNSRCACRNWPQYRASRRRAVDCRLDRRDDAGELWRTLMLFGVRVNVLQTLIRSGCLKL